jgi:hypothetical protein
MGQSKAEKDRATAAPPRNFSVSTEERVRALVSGLPAYVRRLRAIEDLEDAIVSALARKGDAAARAGLGLEDRMRASFPMRSLEKRNDLVERHNRYYPIEANLPMRPGTGEWLDRNGAVWKARAPLSVDDLVARALAAMGGKSATSTRAAERG